MGLTNEAAYLYVHSKEMVNLTRTLKRLSKRAEKHVKKHQKAKDEKTKTKHQKKHTNVSKDIKHLVEKHNLLIKKLKSHQVAFAHALSKETSIK